MLGIHLAFVDLSFFLLNSSLISQASISSPLLTCSFAGIKQTSLPGVSITRNRDVNAACNMVNIGVLLALHGEGGIPATSPFSRKWKREAANFPTDRMPTYRLQVTAPVDSAAPATAVTDDSAPHPAPPQQSRPQQQQQQQLGRLVRTGMRQIPKALLPPPLCRIQSTLPPDVVSSSDPAQ